MAMKCLTCQYDEQRATKQQLMVKFLLHLRTYYCCTVSNLFDFQLSCIPILTCIMSLQCALNHLAVGGCVIVDFIGTTIQEEHNLGYPQTKMETEVVYYKPVLHIILNENYLEYLSKHIIFSTI